MNAPEHPLDGFLTGSQFLARGRKIAIEEAIDNIGVANSYTQAEGPDVSEHLKLAKDALSDAMALIQEQSA